MEEEIRNNKEAMDNVTKICCSIVEMIDYMAVEMIDKYSKNEDAFNKLDKAVVDLLLDIDSFAAMSISGMISNTNIEFALIIFNRAKDSLNSYIKEDIYSDVTDLDECNILIDIIKAEINIINIISSNKDRIIKHFDVVRENECGPLLIIGDKTIFNPAFNATNENISAMINMYYFVQELCNNEKQIQDLLDRL